MSAGKDSAPEESPLRLSPPIDCFPVVGVGASAGGLEALTRLLTPIPADCGLAFVLIPHLAPNHASLMVELLENKIHLPITEAEDGEPIRVNHVYMIPPDRSMTVSQGRLQLMPLEALPTQWAAIDTFLISLARDMEERAVGIILSGTGSHGSSGVKEIKFRGGLALAQTPESADAPEMPASAIATGVTDYQLAPAQMAGELLKFAEFSRREGPMTATSDTPHNNQMALQQILERLRNHGNLDFKLYRRTMLQRRINRRMILSSMPTLQAYGEYLNKHPAELEALYKDLLINVSAFFREPEAFDILSQQVIPELVTRSDEDNPVRVWVPACATGEEAWTLAMLFVEAFEAAAKPSNLQLFATDIAGDALRFARSGIYPPSIELELTPDRLARFFTHQADGSYKIIQELRDLTLFASQNLIGDPPFSKLDLISCRNFLIYLEQDVQQKVISLFHFGLKEQGTLLLGPSETIRDRSGLFSPLSRKHRLFQRQGADRNRPLELPATEGHQSTLPRYNAAFSSTPDISMISLMHKQLLAKFTPASVLIDRQYQVLCFHGPTGDYLEIPPGEPTVSLISMARQGLRNRLRTAVHRAIEGTGITVDEEARVKRQGRYVGCRITVTSLLEPTMGQYLLVTFTDRPLVASQSVTEEGSEHDQIIKQLEYELKITREDLRSNIEALEILNEGLKAANEESMSMNEEMQSTNEELETAGEELQSMNEELTTVNNQLQSKVDELETRNDDIANLLTCSEVGTLFLDNDLKIKLFTPSVQRLMNLLERDIGRPLADFSLKFMDPGLLDDCHRVLEQLAAIEREVISDEGRTYLRRIIPYRSQENRIDGVVITFIDINDRKQADALARVLQNSNDAIIVQGLDGRIQAWNRGAEIMYGYTEEEALSMPITQIIPPERRMESATLIQQYRAGAPLPCFETQRQPKNGKVIDVSLTVTPLLDTSGAITGLATTERDITQRKRDEQELRSLNRELEQRVATRTAEIEGARDRLQAIYRTAPVHLCALDTELQLQSFNRRFGAAFISDRKPVLGHPLNEAAPVLARALEPALRQSQHKGTPIVDLEVRLPDADNPAIIRTFLCYCDFEAGSQEDGMISVALQDITGHKALQNQLLSIADETQQNIGQTLHDDICQELTGLTLKADALRLSLLKKGKPVGKDKELIEGIVTALDHTRNKVRTLSHGLTPIAINADQLPHALMDLLAKIDEIYPIDCQLEADETLDVGDDELATQLFHIAQESLSNALKHSRASRIQVSLHRDSDGLILQVEDDGAGFDTGFIKDKGLGLNTMRLRAERVGATLEIGPGESGGTRVQCRRPEAPNSSPLTTEKNR